MRTYMHMRSRARTQLAYVLAIIGLGSLADGLWPGRD